MVQLQLIVEGIALVATIRTSMVERRQDLETLSPTHLSTPVFDKRQRDLMSISGQGFAPIRRIIAIIVELIGPSKQRHCKLRRLVDAFRRRDSSLQGLCCVAATGDELLLDLRYRSNPEFCQKTPKLFQVRYSGRLL